MAILTDLHVQGMTIVMVTHDPRIAAFCNREVHILDGQVATETCIDAMAAQLDALGTGSAHAIRVRG